MAALRDHRLVRCLLASVIVTLATALTFPFRDWLLLEDVVMVYLLAIMLVGAFLRRAAAVVAAAGSVAAFDYFFVPPAFTFAVKDPRHLLTFAVMFTVGLVISSLAVRLRHARELALVREARTRVLYELGREIARANDLQGIVAAAERALSSLLRREITIEIREEEDDAVVVRSGPPADVEEGHLIAEVSRQIVTEMNRAKLARDAAQATLRARGEELRSALLSAVSHDLRTPLAMITGTATMLRDGNDDQLPLSERRELLAALCDQADHLEQFVGNLLDMTRVQAGVELRYEWIPLEEIVEGSLSRFARKLEGREVSVRLPKEPVVVRVDAVLFDRVLGNVLENASKYTPEGSPIEIVAEATEQTVTLAISDRGPGLPAGTQIGSIFDKFVRGPHTGVAGVGLGLAIARGIVDAHGGTITAENREGGGASFRIALPRTPSPSLEQPQVAS